MEEPTQESVKDGTNRRPDGTFGPGNIANPEGRPPDTPEKRIIKKAIKEIVDEYKENLANALPLIEPVVIAKAMAGDMTAVKEIHDRVMDKSRQPTDIDVRGSLTIQFAPTFKKDADTPPRTGEGDTLSSEVQDNQSGPSER